ncbi:MAG: hypothetical protein FWH27_08720 [Planctomycetaceae bacterium]|nr:hypothetical protein [Planctomycetaceae bacterium]
MKWIQAALMIIATTFGNVTLPECRGDAPNQGGDKTMLTRWGKSLNPDQVLPDYPRPQMIRNGEWLNLNGYWELEFPNRNDRRMPQTQSRQPGQSQTVPILVPFPIESRLSGFTTHATSVTYRKRFRIPGNWPKNSRILLHFGAVDWESIVQVNGKHIGTHRGGYDAFSFDITDALLTDAEQVLVVTVTDPTEQGSQPRGNQSTVKARGQHTSVTGIWQTVWLEPVPQVSIRQVQLTPDFDGKSVKLQIFGENLSENHIVKAELYDGEEFVTRGFGGTDGAMILRIPESRFKPWSPEEPQLYTINIALLDNNQIIDQVESYTGIRKIEVVPVSNDRATIYLNGKPYFQKGVTSHGMWPDGLYTPPSEEALRSDLMVARMAGFNMIRKPAKVEPQLWYYYCDAVGMLVWQEIPAGHNNHASATAQFDAELGAIVRQLYNHPSVVCWVLFQQGIGEHNPQFYADKMQQLDPSRLLCVSSGSDSQPLGNVFDVYMLPELHPMMHQSHQAQTIGRYGGIDLYVKDHSWSTEHWGYREVSKTTELLAEFQRLTDVIVEYRDQFDVSAAVYHQLVDWEEETNGLMTYDRDLMIVNTEDIKEQLEKLDYE